MKEMAQIGGDIEDDLMIRLFLNLYIIAVNEVLSLKNTQFWAILILIDNQIIFKIKLVIHKTW